MLSCDDEEGLFFSKCSHTHIPRSTSPHRPDSPRGGRRGSFREGVVVIVIVIMVASTLALDFAAEDGDGRRHLSDL